VASLKDIRRRISSVKNTQQITKAMKMVAAAKLRRAQDMITNARPFAEKIEELSQRLIGELAQKTQGMTVEQAEKFLLGLHPLLRKNTENPQKIALIVVSSDRGLCGAYNTNLIKFAVRHYQALTAENAGQAPELFFVGKKARDFFAKKGIEGTHYRDFWTGSFNRFKSAELSEFFVKSFIEGTYDRVEIVYTEFVSVLTQRQKARTLLPLTLPEQSQNADAAPEASPFIYKPGQKELLEKLLPAQVQTQFFRSFADSLASELGSRMTSMDNATRNAKEMIQNLTLEANRVRQASITRELIEIVSGAEALKA
jgi:F-type H+-transporting ATPase subunit gamma